MLMGVAGARAGDDVSLGVGGAGAAVPPSPRAPTGASNKRLQAVLNFMVERGGLLLTACFISSALLSSASGGRRSN